MSKQGFAYLVAALSLIVGIAFVWALILGFIPYPGR